MTKSSEVSNISRNRPKGVFKNFLLFPILFMLLSIPVFGHYSIFPSSTTTNGGGTWGSILWMSASLNGNNITFTVRKQSGTFKNTSSVYLKLDGYSSTAPNADSGTIYSGGYEWSTTIDPSQYYLPKAFFFRVVNSEGYAWVGPINVDFSNSNPYNPTVVSEPTSGSVWQSLNYSYRISDPDNDQVKIHISWGDGSGTWDSGLVSSGSTVSRSHSYGAAGTYDLYATVFDEHGWPSSTRHAVINITSGNHNPNNPTVLSEPTSGNVGQSLTYSYRISDPDNDQVKIHISWGDGSGTWDSGLRSSGSTVSRSHSYGAVGTYDLYATVFDEHGAPSSTRHAVINITSGNHNPNNPTVLSEPTSGNVGQSLTYSYRISDPDNDQVKIHISWGDGSGTWDSGLRSSGSTVSRSHSYGAVGTYDLYATVFDEHGAPSSTRHAVINITSGNHNPNNPTVLSEPTSGNVGQSLTYSYRISDPDNDQVKIHISWGDGSGTWDSGLRSSGSTVSRSHSYGAVGTYDLYATVFDEHGAPSSTRHVVITVSNINNNQNPNNPTVISEPTSGGVGQSLTFVYRISDPDNDRVKMEISWGDNSGKWKGILISSGSQLSASHYYGAPGTYHLYATVFDEHGAASNTRHVLVSISNNNSRPNEPTVISEPICGVVRQSLTYTYRISDPDNDRVKINISWGDDSGTWDSGLRSSGSQVSCSHSYGAVGTYGLYITVFDEYGTPSNTKKLKINVNEPNLSVQIIAPNNTSTWEKGSRQIIRWTSGVINGLVNIDLYKGSRLIGPVGIGKANGVLGTYVWNMIPFNLEPGTDYKIRIFQETIGEAFSDFFSITEPSKNPDPKTHIIALGVRHTTTYRFFDLIKYPFRGDTTARNILNIVRNYKNFGHGELLVEDLDSNEVSLKNSFFRTVRQFKNRVNPGDVLIVYIGAHGTNRSRTGNDGEIEDANHSGEDEALLIGTSNSSIENYLNDDEVYDLFNDDKWQYINKLFLLDSCHSGGFWGDGQERGGDLEKLEKVAVIAAAGEMALSLSGAYPFVGGTSYFGNCLEQALDFSQSLTFAELVERVSVEGRPIYYNDWEAREVIRGEVLDDSGSGGIVIFTEDLVGFFEATDHNFDSEINAVADFSITSPAGNQSFVKKSPISIIWTTSEIINSVKIDLYKNNIWLKEIVHSNSNSGSFSWTIPGDLDVGEDYQIKISDTSDKRNFGSSQTFSIKAAPEISLISPSSLSNWPTKSTRRIVWASTNDIQNVKINLYKGGSFVKTLSPTTDNSGSYVWEISAGLSEGSDYTVRVSDFSDEEKYDESEQFTICSPKSFTVITPNGGETLFAGSAYSINWISEGGSSNVWIRYSTDNGENFTDVITETPNSGSYNWSVPHTISSNCLIRISDVSNDPFDVSDSIFSIVPGNQEPTKLSLSRTELIFGAVAGGAVTDAQKIFISNSRSGTLNWTATPSHNRLKISPSGGTGNGVITVSVKASGVPVGTHTGTITVTDPNATNSPQTINVTLNVKSSGSKPFGDFSTPKNGSRVYSSVPVSGWALDDIEVVNVKIYQSQGGKTAQYVGDAVFVEGARPDLEEAYPDYPMNYKAGWGYMLLTNFLPNGGNGTYKLHAVAFDAEGNQVTLGTKTIICNNASAVKPFGAIDTPTAGGIASGNNYKNVGWVLTPMPNKIPENGSTIDVYVDGVKLGNPTYNQYRGDIASLFPGYANSNGAKAAFNLNTTAYTNGVHSIYWIAEDNAGNADGIGSRFFTIQNTGSTSSAQKAAAQGYYLISQLSDIPVDYSAPVKVKKGNKQDTEPQIINPNTENEILIEIRELERIEVCLNELSEGRLLMSPYSSGRYYLGYQIVGEQLKPFPIGSTFDNARGILYWQTGPGFVGIYRFVFIEKSKNGEMTKRFLAVNILPKFPIEE